MGKKILLAGESWMSYTTHVKGFDTFYTSVYETGEKYLKAAMEKGGYEFVFLPNHLAMEEFPFTRSEMRPNRCNLLRDYVLEGGALLMVGGYMTFSGVDGKGKWQDTAVQEVLPVQVLHTDDRMEHCEGVRPVTVQDHPVLKGLDREWPRVLGYNKTILKPEAVEVASVCGDPFIALGEYGKGRSAAFTTDCAPHWAPPEFCEWKGYDILFQNLARWLMREE